MISICYTTRNRPKEFWECMSNFHKFHPEEECELIIVNDASDTDYTESDYRFGTRSGIPTAKNKCLELAKGDHIFLFDDDTYPIKKGWELPYIKSGANHLCYTFLPAYKEYGYLKAHTLGNGCMMYFTRKCINTVGGFDTRFGMGKYEHVNLSRRIYNAGLTPYVFIDIKYSSELIYCLDQDKKVTRSFSDKEAEQLLQSGRAHFQNNLDSSEYISI